MRILAALMVAAVLVAGCDAPQSPVAVTAVSPPHHGTIITLPDDRGLVELVNEPEVSDRRNPEPTAIVAYFLQKDGKAPLSPSPDDVNFTIAPSAERGGRSKPDSGDRIPLKVEPNSGDPLGAGRFASKLGPYALTGIRGKLTAKIGGQEISSEFGGSR
jgi:hypothetical protein